MGTPEEPLFTYDPVHHSWGRDDLELHVGADIPTEEKVHLSQASGPTLKKLKISVEANRPPKLPGGVLPHGWDAWGRPAEKVPQVVSAQGCERVTVAVLIDFPPEPLYFPAVTHLDFALRCWIKAGRKVTILTGLELREDGHLKDARSTHRKLKLVTYNNSVPVQELLMEHRWKAFQEGQWGNRPNPAIPKGDMSPHTSGAETNPAVPGEGIELPPVGLPTSHGSHGSGRCADV